MDERSERIARRFELPILIAALLVIPVIVIEESDLSHDWKTLGTTLNWAIWVAFAFEVIVMLAVVPSKRRWLRDNPLEVAIVVLTPPFLPASLQALRVFRLLRVLRLLRLARLGRRLFSLQGLRYVALLALVMYPVTMLGRVIGMAVMLVGIGFIAVFTGAVAQRFLASQIEEAVDEVEATDAEVLAELREVRGRLDRLEARLCRSRT